MNGKTRARTAIRISSVCSAAHVRYACNTSVPCLSRRILLLPSFSLSRTLSFFLFRSLTDSSLPDQCVSRYEFFSDVARNFFRSIERMVFDDRSHNGPACCLTYDTNEHVKPLKYSAEAWSHSTSVARVSRVFRRRVGFPPITCFGYVRPCSVEIVYVRPKS